MNLSPHFTEDELTVSAAAARAGKKVVIPDDVRPALVQLCSTILEPLRVLVGRPVVILSGYRPPWLNKMVGGSPKSQHMAGEAADLIVPGLSNIEVCARILEADLPFDQLILEFPPQGWVHVSVSGHRWRRGEALTATKVKGKTVYTKGIGV